MLKYAKQNSDGTYSVGVGTNSAFYMSIGMTIQDVEQGYDGNWYSAGNAPRYPDDTILEQEVRAERDTRINACQWIVDRHADQLAANITPTLTEEQYQAWLAYRQALRDLPQQEGFPWKGENVPYPEEPNT